MSDRQQRFSIVAVLLLFVAWRAGIFGDVISLDEPGPRVLLIARESAEDSAQHNLEYNRLRTGEASKYLAGKQHTFLLLDVDLVDGDGKESLLVSQFGPFSNLPELLIIKKPNKVLARLPFVDADAAMETLKANGG